MDKVEREAQFFKASTIILLLTLVVLFFSGFQYTQIISQDKKELQDQVDNLKQSNSKVRDNISNLKLKGTETVNYFNNSLSTTSEDVLRSHLFFLVSRYRADLPGRSEAVFNQKLMNLAQRKSVNMAANNTLSHSMKPDVNYSISRTDCQLVSENVARFDFTEDRTVSTFDGEKKVLDERYSSELDLVNSIHQGFLDSEEHRKNLGRAFADNIGIGFAVSDGEVFVTEFFCDREDGSDLR